MTYNIRDFDAVPSAKAIVSGRIDLTTLPGIEEVKTLARWRPDVLELFAQDHATQAFDRSSALSRLAYSGAELGWTDEQIAAVIYDADTRWGKYVARKDSTRDNIIMNMINRAREKHGYVQMGDIDVSRFKRAEPEEPGAAADPLIWGFQDFVSSKMHIDWILDGLLPMGAIGLMTGYPGTGKTQLCLQMAASLALGEDRFLKWKNVGGMKKVMFLSLEMGRPSMHYFTSTIAEHYSDRETLNRNFLMAPFGEALPLDTEPGQAFLNNLLDEYQPDVLFIDSLQMIVSKEMTDELAVKAMFSYLKGVRKRFRCAMVIVHHNRKRANESQKRSEPDISDVYGSTFIAAEVDFILSLRKTETADLLELDSLKIRLGRSLDSFEIFRDKNLHFDDEFANLQDRFDTRPKSGKGLEI